MKYSPRHRVFLSPRLQKRLCVSHSGRFAKPRLLTYLTQSENFSFASHCLLSSSLLTSPFESVSARILPTGGVQTKITTSKHIPGLEWLNVKLVLAYIIVTITSKGGR
jgi:hypothetical protein